MRRSLILFMALSLGTPLAAVAADPTPAAVAEARSHFQRGVTLYEEEDWRGALVEFRRAHEMAPNAAVLFNIGQAQYQLRDYAGALTTFERFLAEGGAAITAPKREIVDKEVAELRGRVAKVLVNTDADGAEIAIDDVPVGKSPLSAPVRVSTGSRKITVTHSGRVVSRVVELASNDNVTVELSLPPLSGPVEQGPRQPQRTLSYVSLGIGGAGLVVGGVFGLLASSSKSDLDKTCVNKACPRTSSDTLDAFNRNATISTVGFGIGLAGLGAGAALYLVSRPDDRPTGIRVVPLVGPGSAGVAGAF